MPCRRHALVALLLVLPLALLPAATGDHDPGRLIVGYAPGDEAAAHTAIKLAGGEIQRSSSELGFAVVTTSDPGTFRAIVTQSPAVQYVETDDRTRIAGGQWNGAQWNGAQWNGGQWNGGQWNGGQWNGAQWNDASLEGVSEAQRRAAKWTEALYQADSTNKMKWAGDYTDPGLVWQWAPWAANADHAWRAGHVGTRTASLCVLDSGVAWDHPDIAPNYVAGYNAIDPSKSAYDDGGHGTHIAGVAAASLANAYGVAGVGNVQILNAKVLNGEGTGHESDLAFGLLWCARQDAEVAVMALSVTESDHPTLQRALQHASDKDVLLVASAGNDGACTDCVAFPARDPRVVAVSAVDGNLTLASFSSRGPQVEVAAPGVYVLGTFPGNTFVFGSGTSQAAGYAAGAAALLRDGQPQLTAAEARARLSATATDLGAAGPDDAFGHGLVTVTALLAPPGAG